MSTSDRCPRCYQPLPQREDIWITPVCANVHCRRPQLYDRVIVDGAIHLVLEIRNGEEIVGTMAEDEYVARNTLVKQRDGSFFTAWELQQRAHDEPK